MAITMTKMTPRDENERHSREEYMRRVNRSIRMEQAKIVIGVLILLSGAWYLFGPDTCP